MFSISSHFSRQNKAPLAAGFGIIELLVSISIVVIITSVIVVQQRSFNSSVLLRSQAYRVALDARQTQLSAVSVTGEAGEYRSLRGLHFDKVTNNQKYQIFRDADDDGYYDAAEAFGKQGTLDRRFEIRDIRINQNSGGTVSVDTVSVVFERPNFDAHFFRSTGRVQASSIEIDIAKKDVPGGSLDIIKTIEITATGQIAVQ